VHTAAEVAGAGRFGGRIAHGLRGMSVAMGLASRIGVFETCSIALLCVDRVETPALIHDRGPVRCRVEIVSARLTSNGDAGMLERRFTLLSDDDRVSLEGDIALMASFRQQDGDRHPAPKFV
jgi:acyl dehydratase